MNQAEGYIYAEDKRTGKKYATDIDSGEMTEATTVTVPVGTVFFTPKEQEEHQKRKEREYKSLLRRTGSKEMGSFVFLKSAEKFKDIRSETVIRLIYLSTYIKYGSNILMLTERTSLKKRDLAEVLGISTAQFYRFWKEVSPTFLTEDEDGNIYINKAIVSRGKMKAAQMNPYMKRVFIQNMRKVYHAAASLSDLRRLGYIFELLPYISAEYNILCWNPLEADMEAIEPITLAEFCDLVGFDKENMDELLEIYSDLRFEAEGKLERFCSIAYDGIDKENAKIFVNPRVLYSGNAYNQVEILKTFFND